MSIEFGWMFFSDVALGKAAHRCHGDLRCIDRCILVGPWVVRSVRGGLVKNQRGEWTR
jgi:hypothetical protein